MFHCLLVESVYFVPSKKHEVGLRIFDTIFIAMHWIRTKLSRWPELVCRSNSRVMLWSSRDLYDVCIFLKKHMFNSGMNGFNFIRILKLSDFLDVSTQVLAIHLMWKMATPDQRLEVTNRPQLKHNFHRFWLFPVIKLYLVVVWYNKERSFEITTSQVVILISNWGSEFQLSF